METKWLEDFVSLAETRSFSRSAQLRHVTQPAFSRRIQSLEAWAGVDLVDRSSYPTTLTPAGETLYAQALEMLLGPDAEGITVICDGGTPPGAAAKAWAHELQPGAWFSLDHNDRRVLVQYAWRSEGRQLHLFTTHEGPCFLLQSGRLAAYLQAGLMVPHEDEALTVRATRDALVKLGANPERLLA